MATQNKTKRRGQPTKLTAEVQARICAAIAAGSYLEPAAAFAGICEATLHNWLARGEREPGPYRDFLEAVKKAEAEIELHCVKQIREAIRTQWTAAAWLLERKYPGRWGRRQEIELGPKTQETFSLWLQSQLDKG